MRVILLNYLFCLSEAQFIHPSKFTLHPARKKKKFAFGVRPHTSTLRMHTYFPISNILAVKMRRKFENTLDCTFNSALSATNDGPLVAGREPHVWKPLLRLGWWGGGTFSIARHRPFLQLYEIMFAEVWFFWMITCLKSGIIMAFWQTMKRVPVRSGGAVPRKNVTY